MDFQFLSPISENFDDNICLKAASNLNQICVDEYVEHYTDLEKARRELFELLQSNYTDEAMEFWYHFVHFKLFAESIVQKILLASIKRKNKGIPALAEQDSEEQLSHLKEHLENWTKGKVGDMNSIEDQAKHTACRALLALYAFMWEKHVSTTETDTSTT